VLSFTNMTAGCIAAGTSMMYRRVIIKRQRHWDD